jgi:hypothetical protein
VPTDAEKAKVHELVENLIAFGAPETFTYQPEYYEQEYEMGGCVQRLSLFFCAPRSLDCLFWFHSFIARVDFQSHPLGGPERACLCHGMTFLLQQVHVQITSRRPLRACDMPQSGGSEVERSRCLEMHRPLASGALSRA